MPESDNGLACLVGALEKLGIPYFIGGSLASSIYGTYRATADVDLIASVQPPHIPQLVSELSGEFYVDAGMIEDALAHGRPFNLIHFRSTYKFDIFPLPADAYAETQLARRAFQEVSLEGGRSLRIAVASPEDTVLGKLAWYRAGGEISERQWGDIRGVIAVQRDRLDYDYLHKWAAYLKVADLLGRALEA